MPIDWCACWLAVLFCIDSPDADPVVLDLANELPALRIEADLDPFIGSLCQQPMPDRIFYERLDQHGSQPHFVAVQFPRHLDPEREVREA